MEEAEALAERRAVRLDRLPHRFVLGVVVDDQHFEVRVVERAPANRASGSPSPAARCSRADGSTRTAASAGRICNTARICADHSRPPQNLGELEAVDQQHGHHRDLRREDSTSSTQSSRAADRNQRARCRARRRAMPQPGSARRRTAVPPAAAAKREGEPKHRTSAQQDRGERFPRPGGVWASRGRSKGISAWRSALNMPQYAPVRPSWCSFHGWSNASIT